MLTYEQIFESGDIENLAQRLVYEELVAIVEGNKISFCLCDICVHDIVCLTLNKVPGFYTSSILERLVPSEEFQSQYEQLRLLIRKVLPESIELVKEHSHH
ncbi:late competence development ComFB family protein [Maridesulfovibrio bastinii]|uniref:late competence development ComFB family protein n=1 Tax=Maridesulfovibrio bastinii TaxID=47157 RepID=UPI000409F05F|nr:late competence development ComFB family protein [Maridesulfovibrio bastinii]